MFTGVVVAGLAIVWLLGEFVFTETAPDFTVELLDGGSFTLSEHLAEDGRPLILNLWASWCPPCRAEMPGISAYATANPDIAVLGVAVEDRLEPALEFAEEVQVSYPLGFDEGDFWDDYRTIGKPATYFINPDGTIASLWVGVVNEEILDAGFE